MLRNGILEYLMHPNISSFIPRGLIHSTNFKESLENGKSIVYVVENKLLRIKTNQEYYYT